MTWQYEAIDIHCPTCGQRAKFEEPFQFCSAKEVDPEETRPCHQWGSWIVIERFPAEYPWKAPATLHRYWRGGGENGQEGYPFLTHGLIRCSQCYTHQKHQLNWPDDAYWRWQIRGQLLWAWDEAHAIAIRDHIQQTLRPPRQSYNLRHIPTHFLTAKVRDLVVQSIEQSLKRG